VSLHRHRSHELQPIEHCDLATAEIEELGIERSRWPGVAELEIFAGAGGSDRVVALRSSGERVRAVPDTPAGLVVDGKTLRSPGRVRVSVLGRNFSVSAGVFWQVHPGAASTLGREVLHALGSVHGRRVVDLYCGAGLFAALVGRAVGDRGSVLGVERDEHACGDAARNTADLRHVEILRAAVTPRLVAEQLGAPDAVILDPAREGAGRKVMTALCDLDPAPRCIVYVSCDPASFARDLKVVLDAGWGLDSLKGFDLFPMTEHVELVAALRPGDERAPSRR
jgi:tRNA/tmRNA/rRNA uracil-C5-methylase (TrmA/RlmC/RlmD family)